MASITRADALALLARQDVNEIIKPATEKSAALSAFRKITMTAGTARMPVLSAIPTAGWVKESATDPEGAKPTTGLRWEDKSSYIRAHLVQSGWGISESTGFLGAGPGGFERMALDEANPHRSTGFSNAHWGMIEVLVNYGAPTLVVLLAVLIAGVVWAVRSARRLRIGGDSVGSAVMFGAGVLALTLPVVSMSHSTWLMQPLTSVHLMIMVAAFAVGGRRLEKLEES